MKTYYKYCISGLLLFLSTTSYGSNELIADVKNEYVLMWVLGGGVMLLTVCILTLILLLYRVFPLLMRKRLEQEQQTINE